MTIEFHFPQGKIQEPVLDFIKKNLVRFHHMDKEISRAEVYFKEQATEPLTQKICEIDLTIYGDSIFVRRLAGTFEEAARQAIETLSKDVALQIKSQEELPDEVVSTVKV
jgi:hypothetical protein